MLLVFTQMTFQQLVKLHCLGIRQKLFVLLGSIATNIVIVDEVGSSRDIEGGFCCPFHLDGLTIHLHSTICFHISTTLCRQCSRNSFLFHTLNGGDERLAFGFHSEWKLTFMRSGETESTLLACLYIHHHNTISQRSNDTTGVLHIIIYIGSRVDGCLQVQFTYIVLYLLVPELHIETAHREETHSMRTLDELLVDQVFSIPLLAFKDQVAHLGQILQ